MTAPVSEGFRWARDWMLRADGVVGTVHHRAWTKWTFHCSVYGQNPRQGHRGWDMAFAHCNQCLAAAERVKEGAFVGQHM